MAHGKSCSAEYPIGKRSKAFGFILAPKSLRDRSRFIANHTREDIGKALGFDYSGMDCTVPENRKFLEHAGIIL